MDVPPPPSDPLALPFRNAARSLGGLNAEQTGRILTAAGDLALVLDRKGEVVDLAVGKAELAGHGLGRWVGRAWRDLVTPDSQPKVDAMLSDAAGRVAPRWRQVNHPLGDGMLAIRYLLFEGGDGGMVAIGRDMAEPVALQRRLLAAQQAMERDHMRLRQAEMRYRLLFDELSDPLLVIDTTSGRVLEANPAAAAAFDLPRSGRTSPVADLLAPEGLSTLSAMQTESELAERVRPRPIALADGRSVMASLFSFRQDGRTVAMLRLESPRPDAAASGGEGLLLDRLPDAAVVADARGTVVAVNALFLDLVLATHAGQMVGQPLSTLFARPERDLEPLIDLLDASGRVTDVRIDLKIRRGEPEPVDVAAMKARQRDGDEHLVLTFRPVAGRRREPLDPLAPQSVEQLTELVGRVALKDIVRESTDLIERLCIEAALRTTSNNRALAAELLGLSRQSLYSKLHRHGLESFTGAETV